MIKIMIEIIRWFYWYPFRLIVQRIPLGLSYWIADISVPFIYLISIRNRNRIKRGLEIMFRGKLSRERQRRLTLDTFRNILYSAVEVLWYPKLTAGKCNQIFTFEGIEHLENALKAGQGTVLLHGHFGNAHLIMPAIGYKGYRLSQVGSRKAPEPVYGLAGKLLTSIRRKAYEIKLRYKESLPVNFIYTDGSIRDIFRRLENNEVIAIGMDGREGTKWIDVDFLGRKAFFYTGTMKVILKSKPVVLPTFHIRRKDHTHVIVIEPPMHLELSGDEDTDLAVNTRRFVNILEGYVYKYPDLYARLFCVDEKLFFLD